MAYELEGGARIGIPGWMKGLFNPAARQPNNPIRPENQAAFDKANKSYAGPTVYKSLIGRDGNSNMDASGFTGKSMSFTAPASIGMPDQLTNPPILQASHPVPVVNNSAMPQMSPSHSTAVATTQPRPSATASPVRTTTPRRASRKAAATAVPDTYSQTNNTSTAFDAAEMANNPPISAIQNNAGYGEISGDPSTRIYAEQAPAATTPPIAGIPAPAPQRTSTVGYGNGIETYGGDGNLISSTRKLDSNATLGDVLMAKVNSKLDNQAGQTRQYDAAARRYDNESTIAGIKLPYDIKRTISQSGVDDANSQHLKNNDIIAAIKLPTDIRGASAVADLHDAQRGEIEYLKEARRQGLIADADYKTQLGKATESRLSLLKQQMEQQAKQPKGSNYDWKAMNSSAAEAIKLLSDKKSAGGLSPEEENELAFWKNGHKESWSRMRKDGYMPQQIQTEG